MISECERRRTRGDGRSSSAALTEPIAIVGTSDISGNGTFAPKRMLDWLRAKVDAARRAGQSGVRVCQEMFTLAPHESGAEYECMLNDLVREQPLVTMCIYDRNRLNASIVRESFVTHPFVWVRQLVCENPMYLPPTEYLAEDRQQRQVEGFLDQLFRDESKRQRHRSWFRDTLAKVERERHAVSQRLHDELGQALVVLSLQGHHDTVDDEARFFEQLRDQRASGVLVLAVRHAIVHDDHEGPAQPLCTPFHAATVVGFALPPPGGAW